MDKTKIQGKKLAWLLTLIYFSSYVTRINFAAIIQEIVTVTGYEKTALSVILVVLSITYGAGQIINGRLGDKIKPQVLILIGLITATAVNLAFPLLINSIPLMTVFWGINGFAQAMMWPPIVKILVSTSDSEMYGYSVVRVSWGSSFGTIIIYLTAPLLISFIGWQSVFYASAIIGTLTVIIWLFTMNRIDSDNKQVAEDIPPEKGFKIPKEAILPLIFIALGIILQGMLRDGITSWMPTYLAEVFKLDNTLSILITVSLAIFSIICFSVSGTIYKKFFKNEVFLGAMIFLVSAVSALILFLFFDKGVVLTVVSMALITGCMHGINLMLISHVPKRFKKYGNISTISGVINSCTYIGSAIFTYGVALFSENLGWQFTVGIWAIIALLGTAVCLIAYKPWEKFYNK
jgi:OPA family glycerol-3-phosphate transporter-like MFS transporter